MSSEDQGACCSQSSSSSLFIVLVCVEMAPAVADPAVAEAPETKKSTKAPPPQREGAGRDRKAVVRLEVD